MRPWWRSAPGIAGLGVVGALLALLFLPGNDLTLDTSSYGVGRSGYRLGFEVLGELGYETVRFIHGAEVLPSGGDAVGGTLWLLEPGPSVLDEGPAGMAGVAEWVAQGHTLVLAFGPERSGLGTRILHDIQRRREAEEEATGETPPSADVSGDEEALRPTGDAAEALFALGLHDIVVTGARAELDVGFDDPIDVTSRIEDVAYLRGVRDAPVLAGDGLAAGEALVSSRDGVLVWRGAVGRGEVFLVSEARLLNNWAVAGADNAILLAALARMSHRGGPVLYEEFSHGYASVASLTELLLTPPALFVTLQVALLLLAVVLWRARRFGPALPAPAASRRSRVEHVTALAHLHQRGGHHLGAAQRLRAHLVGRLRERLGHGKFTSEEVLLRRLAERLPEDEQTVRDLLEPPGRVDARSLQEYARRLEGLRRRFEEGR